MLVPAVIVVNPCCMHARAGVLVLSYTPVVRYSAYFVANRELCKMKSWQVCFTAEYSISGGIYTTTSLTMLTKTTINDVK
ncbi:hypothetical protein JG687_00015088 [Phytophthora cactorum]|uniref:Uncharacterized protein n=1 Tax=Phytophthora cactorum TaxID=29920 RepID=A0A329RFG4_9STRA|nr:hypothetical protein PC111_g17378 [Phytophthora cactorum]KAG2850036.1 hypothetical protein PC113_g17144 [Phytophthora cactorum]KAG2903487.1 hypothetical protein PC115_g15298 [Phytophthora cactorum]KAG2910240.1 hypothetical protein PC117_g19462 [Phytophthora cactorum]KAG2969220.1 hypothetical protein PC118_g17565 [Phytophthora cactorum]